MVDCGGEGIVANKFSNRKNLNVKINAIGKNTHTFLLQALRQSGEAIKATVSESLHEQTPGGRPYPSKGDKTKIHWASPAGSAPNSDIGKLASSIDSQTELQGPERYLQTTGVVKETAGGQETSIFKRAKALEFGTSKMAPRPFMGPAFGQNVEQAKRRIERAIARGARSGGKK